MFWLQSVVLAQVTSTPSSSGLPGAHLIQEMINWLAQIALWGSLASILLGAAIYGLSQQSGNYAGGYRGKQSNCHHPANGANRAFHFYSPLIVDVHERCSRHSLKADV